MSGKLRVCVVAPSLEILGGQAIQADRICRAFVNDPSVEVELLPVNPRLPGPLRLLQRIKYVRTAVTLVAYAMHLILRCRKYDVLHVFSASYWSFMLAPLPALVVGRVLNVPTLLNYRSGEAPDHLANWRTAHLGMRIASRIVVPSGYLVNVFSDYGYAAEDIPNFVDISSYRFREREFRDPICLSNRNFERHYNVACVIRAFARVSRQHSGARLILAGDGPLKSELMELTRQLGLNNVSFVGRVPPERMPDYCDAADIYLNSPDIDNMPTSIIEAYAAGLAVVTTNAGGIPFIVSHGVTGRMVPCNDDEALAGEVRFLLDNREAAKQMVAKARQACERIYVWSAVRARWADIYARTARRP